MSASSRTALTTAVIPTRNNVTELWRCVTSLQQQSRPPVRIVVCVDGSTDGTLERLEQGAPPGPAEVVVRTHPKNTHVGRAATRNLALQALEGEFVWFVDSDMVAAGDALERHIALVEERECSSQGQVVYENGDENPWAGYLDTRAYHQASDRDVIPFKWYSAANSVVRRDHVAALDGFDERFAGYGGEDFDFAYRLERLTGEPLIYNARSIVTTSEDKHAEAALAQFEEYGATNLPLLESLHPDLPRTFELQRLDSSALADRLFVAALHPALERAVRRVVLRLPRALRNRALNYLVIAAVWRGYRSPRTPHSVVAERGSG